MITTTKIDFVVNDTDVCPIRMDITENTISSWIKDYLRAGPDFNYVITCEYALYLWNNNRKKEEPALDIFVEDITHEQLSDLFSYLEQRRRCYCKEFGGQMCDYEFLLYRSSYYNNDTIKPLYILNVRYGKSVQRLIHIIVKENTWSDKTREIDGLKVIDISELHRYCTDKQLLMKTRKLQKHPERHHESYDSDRIMYCTGDFCLKDI